MQGLFQKLGSVVENARKAEDLPKAEQLALSLQLGQASQHASPCLTAKASDLEIRYSTHHPDEKYHTWSPLQATFQYLKEGIF